MIEDPNFALKLEAPWVEVPTNDPEMYNLVDETREIGVTLSAMQANIPSERLEQVAQRLVTSRLEGEELAAREFAERLTIYEPIFVERPWGYAVAYYGHNEEGRQFSFSGMVTPRTVISLYMSSSKLSEDELKEAMDEVGSRLEFDRTPPDTH